MPFDDLAEIYHSTLDLPINGKTYKVQPVSADVGLHCQLTQELARKQRAGIELTDAEIASLTLDDEQEQVFHRRMLGATLDEMIADKVLWPYIVRASSTVYAWVVGGVAAAERVWAGGARAEAKTPAPTTETPAP